MQQPNLTLEELEKAIKALGTPPLKAIIYVSPACKDEKHFFKFPPDDEWTPKEQRRQRYLMGPVVFRKLKNVEPEIEDLVEVKFSEY